MDVLAHTLWANAAAREANEVAEKKGKRFHISAGWTAWWGVFPDLFAFSIPFAMRFYRIIFLGGSGGFFMRPTGGVEENLSGFGLAHTLYNYSHSLVIWAIVFILVWFFYKRPRYELLGWALHILIDIPSHTLAFFPTPFLFPLSNYHFSHGVAWSNRWFMLINYSALLLVWLKFGFSKEKK